MRKVFTLFCVLMAAFFSIGVANAQSPVVFQTSPEPTDGAFDDANTHWYVMKLKGMFITVENVDGEGNIKLTADNTLTSTNIKSGADQWCIVGSDSEGYQLYNKYAGTTKVLGLKNATSTVQGNDSEYGKSRAQMYAATTTSSTADGEVGTKFVIHTKSGQAATSFFIGLKDANVTNRYFNSRGDYLAYWQNDGSYGNEGSVVTFYDANTYWSISWSISNYASWANNAPVGTIPFTYPESAVNTFKEAVTTAQNAVKAENISHASALTIAATLESAKKDFRKSINGPTDNYVCKIKNPNLGRFIHASTNWTAGSTFPLNNFDNERNVVFVIEKNENGTYKIKSGDTGMYIKEADTYTSTASKEDATDFVIYGSQECNNKVVIGTGNDFSNRSKWLHANNANLIVWEAEAPNSYWEFTQLDEAAVKALADARDAEISSALLIPGVKEALAISDTYTNTNLCKTAESWETYKTAVLAKLPEVFATQISNKYYRINNARPSVNLLATDGGNKPKMYTTADGKKLVSSLWKITLSNNKLKLSNVNNPEKYIATLTDATDDAGKTANDFTDEANAVQFTISRQGDWFTLRDQNNNIFNGEDTGKFPVNYWNGGLGTAGSIWQITEVTSLEVDLHAAEGKSYASVYLPFSVSSVNDGVKAYVAKEPGTNEVTFTETTNGVMANKGFLLISDNAAATATVNIGESNTDSRMLGTLTNLNLTNADKSIYRVFGKNSNGEVGFFTPSGNLNEVKANRGFFTVANGGALRLNFEDSVVSGIDAIEANQALHNAPIFDLSGRRVMNTVKGGLYIQNGRKFIVK